MYPGRDPLLSSLISSRAIVARQSSDAPTNIAWCDEMDRPPRVVDRISRSHILSLKLVVLAFPLHSIVILVNCDNRRGISCRRLFSGENRIRWEDPTSTLLCNKNLVELFLFRVWSFSFIHVIQRTRGMKELSVAPNWHWSYSNFKRHTRPFGQSKSSLVTVGCKKICSFITIGLSSFHSDLFSFSVHAM